MHLFVAAVLTGAALFCNPAIASPQVDSFVNIYSSICLKHLTNLDALRMKLKEIPELPKGQAAHFLLGKPGSVWPVPDKHGVFVVAIPFGENTCAVYARRTDAQELEEKFVQIVKTAPAPLVAQFEPVNAEKSPRNSHSRTISYSWSVPKAKRKMLFMLTTTRSEDAEIQGLATASIAQ